MNVEPSPLGGFKSDMRGNLRYLATLLIGGTTFLAVTLAVFVRERPFWSSFAWCETLFVVCMLFVAAMASVTVALDNRSRKRAGCASTKQTRKGREE